LGSASHEFTLQHFIAGVPPLETDFPQLCGHYDAVFCGISWCTILLMFIYLLEMFAFKHCADMLAM
jgi:hypothetical protein